MGGCCCCCSSKGVELNSSSPFYHYPVVSEEHEPLSSHQGQASTLSAGLLVDTNLETSIPDTYRPPPTPLPYDANLGHPRSPLNNREDSGNKREPPAQITNTEAVGERNISISGDTQAKELKESDCKMQTDIEEAEDLEGELDDADDLKKPCEPIAVVVEECPTCLEEYDEENPKIVTKCEHHFHLSCILEWMERSDTCPVCDQEMVFNPTIEG